MNAMADRLGAGFLNIIEQVVPAVDQFEHHSVLIGWCLIVVLGLLIVWSISGLVRR
jgi:hypothetical protein